MYARDIDIPFYDITKKLRLIKPDPKYAPVTIQWISKDEVTKYLGADFSKMTVEDEVKHLENMVDDDDRYSWMIELDGEIVGKPPVMISASGTLSKSISTILPSTICGPKFFAYVLHAECSKSFAQMTS